MEALGNAQAHVGPVRMMEGTAAGSQRKHPAALGGASTPHTHTHPHKHMPPFHRLDFAPTPRARTAHLRP